MRLSCEIEPQLSFDLLRGFGVNLRLFCTSGNLHVAISEVRRSRVTLSSSNYRGIYLATKDQVREDPAVYPRSSGSLAKSCLRRGGVFVPHSRPIRFPHFFHAPLLWKPRQVAWLLVSKRLFNISYATGRLHRLISNNYPAYCFLSFSLLIFSSSLFLSCSTLQLAAVSRSIPLLTPELWHLIRSPEPLDLVLYTKP